MKSKVYNTTDEEFKQLILSSTSMTDAIKKIGLSINGSNARTQIKKRCIELDISLDHFNKVQKEWISHPKYSLDEILIENSTYTSRTRMKARILEAGLLEYKCECCGNTGEWQNKTLSLQLDHKNGINNDNRIENLRFLCPNCHSQTETFSGKNKSTSC